jgi:SAM-dependent methyltransferase
MAPTTPHYTEVATRLGASPLSTINEQLVRDAETTQIRRFLKQLEGMPHLNTLCDVGCGNGYTLSVIKREFPRYLRYGFEPCEEMRRIAAASGNGIIVSGSLPDLGYLPDSFHVVISQRCLINLQSWPEQRAALTEIRRILKPGGFFLLLECFESGLANINKARAELHLEPLKPAAWNVYLPDAEFDDHMRDGWQENPYVPEIDAAISVTRQFLSTHSFVSRVILPALDREAERTKAFTVDCEMVKFLCAALPSCLGEYSRIQARVFRKEK